MEVRKIGKYKFFRTGEVVADIGILYLYDILQDMNSKNDINIQLKSNYLTIDLLNPEILCQYILDHEVFQVFLQGISNELIKKGLYVETIKGLNTSNFLQEIQESSILSEKDKITYTDRFNRKYFPYIRNSHKYGANSQSEENFRRCFRELIKLVFQINNKDEEKQREILKDYKPIEENCMICHKNISTRLDITHKTEERIRINSKYNYSFFGAEQSTFANYGEAKNNICFECEFLNLMFLLYINRKRPQVLGYTDDLYMLRYINDKLMIKKRLYKDTSFQLKLGKMKGQAIRQYDVITDSNKGIILTFHSLINYEELVKNTELIYIVDNYNYSGDTVKSKDRGKKNIKNSNYEGLRDILLTNLIYLDKDIPNDRISNIKAYQRFIRLIASSKEGDGDMEDKGFSFLGEALGKTMYSSTEDGVKDNKKNIALRITNMLKADDREGIFNFIIHLIVINGIEIPYDFSKNILQSTKNQFHFYIGRFLEGFLKKKGEKK